MRGSYWPSHHRCLMYLRDNIEFSQTNKLIVITQELSDIWRNESTVSCHELFSTLNNIKTTNILYQSPGVTLQLLYESSSCKCVSVSLRTQFVDIRAEPKFLSVARILTSGLFLSSLSSALSCEVRLFLQWGLLSAKNLL